ncbi:MAG: hypothetical protein KDA85_17225, partial [Planctomycetaceae bacterium]|nr:hypothetical protein [Planctomycetaceae bacterium]
MARSTVRRRQCLFVWTLLLICFTCHERRTPAAEDAVPEAIFSYVNRPEPDFQWKVVERQEDAGGKVVHLHVTSQRWHDVLWEHAVEIVEPPQMTAPKHALLFVTGGSQPPRLAQQKSIVMARLLANIAGMRVVVLHQVPNQPLFDNRFEDDAITETWLRYLQDGDTTWPLLFPMVKSAVRTMDAVQQLSEKEFAEPIGSFIITGASKRGWTSWLTPVVDTRIVGTAPVVIDVLNFRAQMKHQQESWGHYSEQIIDYTSKGLIVEGEENEREKQLRLMMDPYTYRAQLTLPKLLVNGVNDPYWVVDAQKLYWHDLHGSKSTLFLPNADHDLNDQRDRALTTIAVFARRLAAGREMPVLDWQFARDGRTITAEMSGSEMPLQAVLWYGYSDNLDFRKSEFHQMTMAPGADGQQWRGVLTVPENAHAAAVYAEFTFLEQGVPFSLTSLV